MKETVITPVQKRRELFILLFSAVAAVALNIIGIVKFDTPAVELLTQLPLVILLTLIIYVVIAVLRIIGYVVFKLIIRTKK
jgi:hypothetical protein